MTILLSLNHGEAETDDAKTSRDTIRGKYIVAAQGNRALRDLNTLIDVFCYLCV